jgi:hypothetical protein
MSASSLLSRANVLSVALEDARRACIRAQNNRDFAAIKQTNKTWNKIDKAFKKLSILRSEDMEEERFQRALAEALEKRRKEDESMRSLGITVSYAQAERIAEEDEEFEAQSQSCYKCGDTYCHATKEAYDEDTGHCPDCVAFQQWKNFSVV